MKRSEWDKNLTTTEQEALMDYYPNPETILTPHEVFETIVKWEGGMATAREIKMCIACVYGIDLDYEF